MKQRNLGITLVRGWLHRLVRCFGGIKALTFFLMAVALLALAVTVLLHSLEIYGMKQRLKMVEDVTMQDTRQ